VSALSYALWAVLAAAVCVMALGAHTPGTAPARPSVVLRGLAGGTVVRVVLVLAWMWTGWHLFAR
jgi:hypothetical protein